MKKLKIKLKDVKNLLDNDIVPYIQSPTGMVAITDYYIKHNTGYILSFEDGTELKCAISHKMFNGTDFVDAQDVRVGDVFSNKVVVGKEFLPTQEWNDFSVAASHESYIHKGLIHHNSGKSAILYCIINWILEIDPDSRVMLIVPNIQLVNQMFSDFREYSTNNGFDVDKTCQKLYGGQSKDLIKRVLITTWQSFSKLAKTRDSLNFMRLYRGVLVDEAHGSSGKEIQTILGKCTNAQYRIGASGTIDQTNKAKVNLLQIEGYLGPVHKVITTKELMDAGQVANLKIKTLVLKHPPQDAELLKKAEYADEVAWLVANENRNNFICKVALASSGATLILVRNRETHAKVLYEQLKVSAKKPVYYISGEVTGEQREIIRNLANVEDCIIVATLATMAVGVNIPNLRNIIFGSPSKSMVTVLQSIGRALRLHSEKDVATVYDIIDDLRYKKRENYAYTHGIERLTLYRKEKFDIAIREIALND